jgi:hypothetical protein
MKMSQVITSDYRDRVMLNKRVVRFSMLEFFDSFILIDVQQDKLNLVGISSSIRAYSCSVHLPV